MIRRIVIFLFVLINSPIIASPKLQAPDKVDLGLLPRAKFVTREIEYKNTGTEKLIIGQWSKSCGCVDVELKKTELNPGETAKFKMKIDSGIFIPSSIKVVLFTNDPDKPIWPIKVKFAFHDPLMISPPVLYIEKKRDAAITSHIYLTIKENSDYTIKDVTTDINDISLIKTKINERSSRLDIPIPSDIKQNTNFKIKITSTDSKYGIYEIPVKLRIEPKVRFYPKKLIVRSKGNSEENQFLTKFRILSEEPKEIKEITSNIDIFKFDFVKKNKKEYIMNCLVTKGLEIETKYIENYINVYFKEDIDPYILPLLYIQ